MRPFISVILYFDQEIKSEKIIKDENEKVDWIGIWFWETTNSSSSSSIHIWWTHWISHEGTRPRTSTFKFQPCLVGNLNFCNPSCSRCRGSIFNLYRLKKLVKLVICTKDLFHMCVLILLHNIFFVWNLSVIIPN